MDAPEQSKKMPRGTEKFADLLQRLRAPATRVRKEERESAKVAPAKTVQRPPKLSTGITALLQVWAGGEHGGSVDNENADSFSPSPPAAPVPQGKDRFLIPSTRSAFAPSTDYLPRLLKDTIGRDSRTPHGRALRTALRPFSCVVVDVETTGFSPQRNEMVEIGCVELRWVPPVVVSAGLESAGGTPVSAFAAHTASPCTTSEHTTVRSPLSSPASATDGFWARGARTFHRRIRPSSPAAMSANATAVHGLTWETVASCNAWPVVADELVAFLHSIAVSNSPACPPLLGGGGVRLGQRQRVQLPPLVAHNSRFDTAFLTEHLRRCGYDVVFDPDYPTTCSLQWAQRAYPHVAGNLNAVCSFFCIDGAAERAAGFHGAFVDAVLTAKLFLQLCRRFEEHTLSGPFLARESEIVKGGRKAL